MAAIDSWIAILNKIQNLPEIATPQPAPTAVMNYSKPELLDKDVVCERILYVAPGTGGGTGTKAQPYRTNDIDQVTNNYGKSLKIFLSPGSYTTTGKKVPKRFALIGESPETTVIKLIDNVGAKNWAYPHIKMFCDDSWSEMFYMYGVKLDGNFPGQSEGASHGNFKIEPLTVKAVRAKVENVDVINFGCSSKTYGENTLECFPLYLETFSNGAPYNYDAAYKNLVNNEPLTFLEVVDCNVSQPYFYDGGYCTAIFVKSSNPNSGDRQPFGLRQTLAASVRNNIVNVPGGIAYGCAISEMVEFVGNIANNSKCGFNADTGQVNNVSIIGNQFLLCNQGVNYTPYNGSVGLIVDRNTFMMSEPFYNAILGKNEAFFWLNTPVAVTPKNNIIIEVGKKQNVTKLIQPANLDVSNVVAGPGGNYVKYV